MLLLVSSIALALGPIASVRASPVSYTLYGTTGGWGFTATTITSPGPDLTALPGETVSMTLYSADGVRHNFYVDYNGNGMPDTGEPLSADFRSSTVPTTMDPFTVTSTPGTYTYYCDYHANNQFGMFIVGTPPPPTALADLVQKKAWPEHHHFSILGDEDGLQRLFGRVANLGTVDTAVRVDFEIHNATTDEHITTVSTGPMALTPGQVKNLSIDWSPQTGKYMVEARAWFDSDGNGTPDSAGASLKTFTFAVVP